MAFTHLHVHTEYSLLDGSNKIKEYVKRLKELGMTSGAITDHGVMYGVIDFYKEARANGIKPILGCEVYVAPNSRFDKEVTGGEERYHHLVLLAENNQGYSNLMKIVSKGFTEGYYYKPRVDMEVLTRYHEGIIALSACLAGEVPRLIVKGLIDEAKKTVKRYQECFGKDNYFLELQDHGIPQQRTVNTALLQISRELNVPLVATNDIHYTYADDAEAHDILLCIQTAKKVSDEDRMRYEGGQYYVKSEQEMRKLFPYAQDAIDNTAKIAERCNVEIEFGVTKLPKFEVPPGYDSWSYLNKLCFDGLKERYPNDDGTLVEKLNYELGVINKMGYVDYFLIVWDFINWAKENGIPVGPGRGSAAGSIVSYCLHITNIDPIRYNLLFERFLNPERVSMPDIDIDFCYERRQEVIDYVSRKYGHDKVVQIVTFGTMAAKGVIRDVGRALALPYTFCDSLAKMIPNELNITIDKALEMNPEFSALYKENEQVSYLIDMCKKLEGLPRHTSMHAAGVVICQKPADEFVPLSRGSDGAITTQFTMTTIEELGLLKMDFLGLRTLTVIKNAVDNVEKTHGIHIDVDKIDYDDKKVFAYIGTGKTDGIFQLESQGMKNFMKELKPKNLEDVIAGISLYRPGPMDFIPAYIKGKNSHEAIEAGGEALEPVTYACPQLEPILAPTYGCIVYQEQVMQIVRDLGGYTMGRSDLVRRAMSKKKTYVMEQERNNFVHGNKEEGVPGCAANGISEEVAEQIYGTMMDFAKYAFNKSHAACYAVVAYQTAYLKFYYPVEFMAALLSSIIDNSSKVAEYIIVCRNMGIKILPPDINEGEAGFSVSNGCIRYGLTAIKSVGRQVIDTVVNERKEHGTFKSLKNFMERTINSGVNKRTIENFIKAGVFDSFNATRKQHMTVYSYLMDNITSSKKSVISGQLSLIDIVPDEEKDELEIKFPDVGEFDKAELLSYEKEVLGFYISGHPLEEYQTMWEKHITLKTTDFMLDEETGRASAKDNSRATIGGIITEKKIKYTKNNQIMAFITIEDLVGSIEVIVFPPAYEKNSSKLVEENKVFIEGRVSLEDERDGKLICEKVTAFDEIPRTLWIKFPNMKSYVDKENELYLLIHDFEGKDRVTIYIEETRQKKTLPANKNINADSALLDKLCAVFGKDNIKLV